MGSNYTSHSKRRDYR